MGSARVVGGRVRARQSYIYIERRGNSTRHSKVHSLRDCSSVLSAPSTPFDIHSSRLRDRVNTRSTRVFERPVPTKQRSVSPAAPLTRTETPVHGHPKHAMKLALFALVGVGCLIAAVASLEEEYDYEEEAAAAPITPAPAKSNSPRIGGLLASRGRATVGRKTPAATTQSTTAKPVEQPAEVEEDGGEEYDENQDQQEEETPTTTTESSKKVRGGVRPFRSNQDLLAALKRRRAQVGPSSSSSSSSHRETSAAQTATESTTFKSKGTTHTRNKSNGGTANESKSSGRGRFGGSRGNKPVQEEVEETQREEVQVKPKPYRRG